MDTCVLYIKYSGIITLCWIFFYSLPYSGVDYVPNKFPNNGLEWYVFTDEGDISNYLGVNIKKWIRNDIWTNTVTPGW